MSDTLRQQAFRLYMTEQISADIIASRLGISEQEVNLYLDESFEQLEQDLEDES